VCFWRRSICAQPAFAEGFILGTCAGGFARIVGGGVVAAPLFAQTGFDKSLTGNALIFDDWFRP